MTKRSRKHTANQKANAGCMWGLINLLYFRHARISQKLLMDGRHGSSRSASGNNHPRDKLNLMNSCKGKQEDSYCAGENGAGYSNLSTTSVKMLMKKEMSDVHPHKQITCAEPSKSDSDYGAHYISGSAREDHRRICISDVHSSDLRISTNLVSGQPQLVRNYSNNLNFALPQDCYDNKYRDQNISANRENIDLVQNHILLQKTHEVQKLFYRFFDASHNGTLHQSEEFIKALDILRSDEDMFLKGLPEPNSLLVKHIEDHLNSRADKQHSSGPCKLLEAELTKSSGLEQHGETASRKLNIKNIFRKKNKSQDEKQSDDIQSSQPLKRIVLLKPATAKQRNLMNASSPGSSPRSPQNLRASMQNERAAFGFGFTFREIKRRLRHAIGEHKRDQHLKSTDEVLHGSPSRFVKTNQSSCSNEQVYQSAIGGKRIEKIIKPKDYPRTSKVENSPLITNDCRSPYMGTPCKSLGESDFQREAKKHLLEMLDCGSKSERLPATHVSKSLEKVLSLPDYNVSSPRCSPGRCRESGLSPRNMRYSPFWSLSEHIDADQHGMPTHNLESAACTSRTSNDALQELDSEVLIEEQTREDSPVGETSSSRYSPGKDKELQLPLWQTSSSPHQSPSRQIDTSQCSTLTYDAESSPCTSNSSGTGVKELDLSPDPLNSHMEECSSTTEAWSPKGVFPNLENHPGVVKVMDIGDAESMKEQNSTEFDRNIPADAAEGCEHDGSPLQPRLDFSAKKPMSMTPSVPLGVLQVQNSESPESIVEKQERPSPISVLEPPFLDDITSPGGTTEHDGLPITPRELHFEECDNFDVVVRSSNPEAKRRTCMEWEEFKHEYITCLLEASDSSSYGTWERLQFSQQLLDPLLYDVVETSTGEVPDDLHLLFDCINEVLENIHEKYFSCMPWLSSTRPSIRPFPSKENLILEVLRGTSCDFAAEIPRTLRHIIEKDMDTGTWMHLRRGSENIEADVGDEILEETLEETVLELWD